MGTGSGSMDRTVGNLIMRLLRLEIFLAVGIGIWVGKGVNVLTSRTSMPSVASVRGISLLLVGASLDRVLLSMCILAAIRMVIVRRIRVIGITTMLTSLASVGRVRGVAGVARLARVELLGTSVATLVVGSGNRRETIIAGTARSGALLIGLNVEDVGRGNASGNVLRRTIRRAITASSMSCLLVAIGGALVISGCMAISVVMVMRRAVVLGKRRGIRSRRNLLPALPGVVGMMIGIPLKDSAAIGVGQESVRMSRRRHVGSRRPSTSSMEVGPGMLINWALVGIVLSVACHRGLSKVMVTGMRRKAHHGMMSQVLVGRLSTISR